MPGPSADTPPARLRQALLLRAAVATGVMVMLAAGLVLFDARDGDVAAVTSEPAAMSDAAAPDAAASPGSVPVSAAPPPGAVASPALPSAGGETSPSPAAAPTGGPPPDAAAPPAATDIASAPAPVGTPADTAPARAAVSELPATSAQAPDAAATPTTEEPSAHPGSPPPGPGFMVQLGVFTDSANAESLRRELARKGYPAHLQSRVVLGPFPNRQAALAAQEKVRRERKLDGMILPPRKP